MAKRSLSLNRLAIYTIAELEKQQAIYNMGGNYV